MEVDQLKNWAEGLQVEFDLDKCEVTHFGSQYLVRHTE